MSKIRIVFFCRYLNGGGAEKHLARLVNNLPAAEFDKHLTLVRPGGNYERLLNDEVQVHHLFANAPGSATWGLVKAAEPLAGLLRNLTPDIFFSIMDYTNVFAYRAWRKSGRQGKFVVCVQSSLDQAIAFKPSRVIERITRRVVRHVYAHADHIVVLSRGVAAETMRNTRVSPHKVTVINNYGLEPADQPVWKPEPGAFTLVVCGRLIPLKGFDTVIRAIARLKNAGCDVRLKVLGDGPQRTELAELARSEGVADEVSFLGFVDRPQDHFAAASLFVLSSHFEGFGNVIVEAMSVGCPVLSTDCPHGPAEIIDSPEVGVLVPVGDDEAMAREIGELIDNPRKLASMAAAGFENAKRFAPQVITRQYVDLLTEITAGQ